MSSRLPATPDLRLFLKQTDAASVKLTKLGWLALTVVWDQIVYTLISSVFRESKFLNLRQLYKFSFSFNCIYCLFSGILMPNFALQQVFAAKKSELAVHDRQNLALYLVAGLKFNFIVLILSAANFKVLQPILVQRVFSVYTRWKSRRKARAHHSHLPQNNIFAQLQQLKLKAESAQIRQQHENSALIYSLSFTVNCLVSISFYGLLVPSVVFYILPALMCSFLLDFFRFRRISKNSLQATIRQLRQKYSEAIRKKSRTAEERIRGGSESFRSKADWVDKLLLLKRDKYCRIQQIPSTIFINFLMVLVVMVLPSCLVGYFGMAKRFESFLSEKPSQLQSPKLLETINRFVFYSYHRIQNLFFRDSQNKSFVEMLVVNLNELITSTLDSIRNSFWIQQLILFYFIYIFVFRFFFNSHSFLKRTQSKIWNSKEIINGQLAGESLRALNPAYWI